MHIKKSQLAKKPPYTSFSSPFLNMQIKNLKNIRNIPYRSSKQNRYPFADLMHALLVVFSFFLEESMNIRKNCEFKGS